MSQPERDKKSHKPSKSKGDRSDRRPGSGNSKPKPTPKPASDFEKTGGESAVVPEIAAAELLLEKELGTGCFGTVFLGVFPLLLFSQIPHPQQNVEASTSLSRSCIHKKWTNTLSQNLSAKLAF